MVCESRDYDETECNAVGCCHYDSNAVNNNGYNCWYNPGDACYPDYTGAGVCPAAGVTTLEAYDYAPVPDDVRGEWGSSPHYYSSY